MDAANAPNEEGAAMAVQEQGDKPEQQARTPAVRASDAERQQATAVLKQACVEGRLTLEEFGERVGRALAARTREELAHITGDLPVTLAAPAIVAPAGTAGIGGTAMTRAEAAGRKPVSSTIAIMSAAERGGVWRVNQESLVLAVMGECKLDLRQASISAPVTTIRARVLMGNLQVTVPQGVEVELDAMTVAGARKALMSGPPPPAGAPIIRIEGWVVMGELTVRDH
jgi:hypothetical protein